MASRITHPAQPTLESGQPIEHQHSHNGVAEQALSESEERFRLLVEGVKDYAIFMLDATGLVVSWNTGAERINGYHASEIIGRHFSRFYPEADVQGGKPERELAIALREGQYQEEGWRVRKDGTQFMADVLITALYDGTGVLRGFSKVSRDISECKRVEQQTQTLIESIPDAVLVVNEAGAIIFGNVQAEALFGYGREELLGQLIEILLPEQARSIHPARRSGYMAAPQIRMMGSGLALYARRKDGSEFPVDVSLNSMEAPHGRSAIAIVRDITERKQAEENILRQQDELEQRVVERTALLEAANKELESFSYSISHDLRAPLRGIDGWSLALLEDYHDALDAQGRQYLSRVRSETQRMGQLIDDLLQLSRLTRTEIRQEAVNLSALAHMLAARLQETEPERQAEFSIQADLSAEGDASLLEAVMSNLLSNAFKFTSQRTETRIEFGQAESQGRRAFFVRDNGAGFDMAYAHKLFGAFQRLHKASEFPGTGIGLATVQRIVSRHGGRVWVEAGVNQGATFYFTLAPPKVN